MAGPKFITGGLEGPYEPDTQHFTSQGAFAQYPGATKKYILNNGPRDAEYRETMARMFIQMSAQERALFVKSVPPETRALAKVLAGVATGASGGTGFIDFLLTQANEQFSEKYQVLESLSDNYVIYVFGQGAPQFAYSGMLLNTYQDDQRVWMTRLYQDVLRGTQLARRKKLLRMRYDSVIVTGVMLNLNMQVAANQEDRVPFSFNFIPTQYLIYTPALGVPTTVQTPFTPAGKYALQTTQVPTTTRTQIALARAADTQATKKPGTSKVKSPFKITGPVTAVGKLVERRLKAADAKAQKEIDNMRPGSGSFELHGEE